MRFEERKIRWDRQNAIDSYVPHPRTRTTNTTHNRAQGVPPTFSAFHVRRTLIIETVAKIVHLRHATINTRIVSLIDTVTKQYEKMYDTSSSASSAQDMSTLKQLKELQRACAKYRPKRGGGKSASAAAESVGDLAFVKRPAKDRGYATPMQLKKPSGTGDFTTEDGQVPNIDLSGFEVGGKTAGPSASEPGRLGTDALSIMPPSHAARLAAGGGPLGDGGGTGGGKSSYGRAAPSRSPSPGYAFEGFGLEVEGNTPGGVGVSAYRSNNAHHDRRRPPPRSSRRVGKEAPRGGRRIKKSQVEDDIEKAKMRLAMREKNLISKNGRIMRSVQEEERRRLRSRELRNRLKRKYARKQRMVRKRKKQAPGAAPGARNQVLALFSGRHKSEEDHKQAEAALASAPKEERLPGDEEDEDGDLDDEEDDDPVARRAIPKRILAAREKERKIRMKKRAILEEKRRKKQIQKEAIQLFQPWEVPLRVRLKSFIMSICELPTHPLQQTARVQILLAGKPSPCCPGGVF